MKINDIIRDAKTIGIAGHVRPDGDSIGSCMALYNYLKKNRPELNVKVYLELVEEKFKIIENVEDINTNGYDGTVFDLFISLDTASIDRLGINMPYFTSAKRTACIDHHQSNPGYGDENNIVPHACSASEVLYGMLDEDLIDASVALPLYLGIAHDSGVFRFQTTTPETMRIAAKLMETGINSTEILEETYYKETYDQMMVTAYIQSNTKLAFNGKVIYCYCTLETMEKYGVTQMDLESVVATIRNVRGVEVALFMYQLDSATYKISLRSNNDIDVSTIAVEMGGGGHMRAAGFEVEGTAEEIIDMVLGKLKEKF